MLHLLPLSPPLPGSLDARFPSRAAEDTSFLADELQAGPRGAAPSPSDARVGAGEPFPGS